MSELQLPAGQPAPEPAAGPVPPPVPDPEPGNEATDIVPEATDSDAVEEPDGSAGEVGAPGVVGAVHRVGWAVGRGAVRDVAVDGFEPVAVDVLRLAHTELPIESMIVP